MKMKIILIFSLIIINLNAEKLNNEKKTNKL